MNRVSLYQGKSPIIIVAPHGYYYDDMNTSTIADVIATELKAYAVINQGWMRADKAVLGESRANLNDITHCKLDPCRKEFLNPLCAFKDECIKKFNQVNIFYIHGMSNKIRHDTKCKVDLCLGFGQGNPPSYTCSLDYKNAFVQQLRVENFITYQAKVGGKFAAWKPTNLTQIWRQSNLDQRVNSIQIEIANLIRGDYNESINTALRITRASDKFLYSKTYCPTNMNIGEY